MYNLYLETRRDFLIRSFNFFKVNSLRCWIWMHSIGCQLRQQMINLIVKKKKERGRRCSFIKFFWWLQKTR